MSWNEPGNQQDPWAKPGTRDKSSEEQGQSSKSHQQPPDLEEVFGNLLKKMGGSHNRNSPTSFYRKILPLIMVLLVIIWGISGFYTIKEAEKGVVTRFGKLHDIVMPGLNWKPTFIDEVKPVNIRRVSEFSTSGAMLTKDENMVRVEMTVQYRIDEPDKYLFNVKDPDDSLKQATDSALRYVIGHMSMDDILTTGRAVVRENTRTTLREIIKVYDMGLLVTDVNFQYARPPEEVKEAFDDAIKAQEDEQRLIREAEAYKKGREPIARGNAHRIIEQANAYREQVVLDAKGEAERFNKLLVEYKNAPQIMRERLYLQTMEKVMKNTPKLMFDAGSNNNLTVLPMDKLFSQPTMREQLNKTESLPIKETTETTASPPQVSLSSDKPKVEMVRKGRFN